MLTEIERRRLINRDKEQDLAIIHRNDMIVRNKLQKWIDDIPDILFILKHLPQKQLKKRLCDGNVFALMWISDILIQILDFKPIFGPLDRPDEWIVKTKRGEREATDDDINRSLAIADFKLVLSNHSDWTDPAVTAADWIRISPEERIYRIRATGKEPEKIKAALNRVLEAMKPKKEDQAK